MKLKAKQELRDKSLEELHKMLQETRHDLATKKLELSMRKHTNVHVAKDLRKKTAIILTLIREKQLTVKEA